MGPVYAIKRISVLLICFFSLLPVKGQIRINEFLSSNISTLLGPDGNYREWIEIYNSGTSHVSLDGYYLSDDLSNPYVHQIKNVSVKANSFVLIWIDKDEYEPCCEFELDMDRGEIGLFSPAGELLDSVSYQTQYPDVSVGRNPDAANRWSYYTKPTPAAPNSGPAVNQAVLPGNVTFSLDGGMYQGEQYIELSTESGEGIIRYTRDGSWPTVLSPSYSEPILLTSTGVIRAGLFQEGKLPGQVSTKTYILNDSSSIPVVSIVTDAKYFFDDEIGIYVEGSNGLPGNCSEDSVNWNQDWERPANMEYFTREGEAAINQMIGVRLHGGCSRMWDYKSLAVIARNKYGTSRLNYKFFNSKDTDEFKSLILRNSGNDAYSSMLRDGFMQSLLTGQMDLDCQAYQPANVFLNGEYWGILNVREKINEHYPASNYNIHSDLIDMLEREKYILYGDVVHGYGEHYGDLIDFVEANSLTEEANYEYVKTQMDVSEYMNLFLANIYFENEDWPQNNMKYWRPHLEGGKWRWILYDTDLGWGLSPRSGNTLEHATEPKTSTRLIRALLENNAFKNEFIQRMAGLINTTFHPERVGPIYDSILGQLDHEIQRHRDRWGRPYAETYAYQTLTKIPKFTRDRPEIVRGQFRDKFGISGMYTLSATVNDSNKGSIKACELRLPDNFSASYFNNIPLRLEAIPRSGYAFSHWEGASTSESELIYLDLSSDASIHAVFIPDTPAGHIYINEVCASNQSGIRDEFGQNEDWIEIYNDTDFDVNLAGWYLSDSAGLPAKFQIPSGQSEQTTVKAKDYLLIWCDGDIRQGPLHSNFKLKKEGEALTLAQKIDQVVHYVDSLHYPALKTDLTYGRSPDSEELLYMCPTPLARNELGEFGKLFINEFVTKNCGTKGDEFNESDDWVEIYNPGPDTLDLGGLYVTDSLQDPLKHCIPTGSAATRIAPYGFKILWADNQPEQGELHLGFKLDAKDEQIGLYLPGHGYIDSLSYSLGASGMAMGRYLDGTEQIQAVSATPGESNLVRTIENIYINEFMAKNQSTLADLNGEYDDWIEIYNDNDFEVDLGGLYITDSLADPGKCWIPTCQAELTTIPARGFLILWADGQEEQGALHLNFKLSGDGEAIGLVQADGFTYIDSLSYTGAESDMALGCLEDGNHNIQVVSASPGFPNYISSYENLYISEFCASGNSSNPDPAGEYDDWIEIYNNNEFEVNIGGLYLSDSLPYLSKYRIPVTHPDSTTIGARDYLILWADKQTGQGIRHLDFKLSGKGEQLALVNMDGQTVIDSVSFPDQYSNFTYSRTNNMGDWKFLRPTPHEFNLNSPVTGIFINEFMASNSCMPDEYGEYEDWIELYNDNELPVDIGGLYLTDSLGDPTKYRIPSHSPGLTTIPPKGFYVLFADDTKEQGVNHTNFKLSRGGEAIFLHHYDESTLVDSHSYTEQYKNSASGRIEESGDWYTLPPTPGESNLLPDVSGLLLNEVMGNNKTLYSDEYNEYDDWIELYNSGSSSLDVGGLYLTDSLGNPTLFRIPTECPDSTTIPPGGHLLLWADNSENQGILHLGFKISKTGETIGLYDFAEELIDSTSYPFISPNLSWGRTADGDFTWTSFLIPTPLVSNSLTSVSSEKFSSDAISVYPNPVTELAIFELFQDEPSEVLIEIIDSKGRACAIKQVFHHGNGNQKFHWNVHDAAGSSLKSGCYFLRIQTGNGLRIGKLLIMTPY